MLCNEVYKWSEVYVKVFFTQHGYYGRTEVLQQLKSFPSIVSDHYDTDVPMR